MTAFGLGWYNNGMNNTVVVGMSGGVDSSVAALLLKQQGYNVIGLFMVNWEENDENGNCTAEEDYADVRRVANLIGIPYYTVNFAAEYRERVFSYFLSEYAKGRTPNPDVLCNREIKFGPFADYARELGADFIATGHYCGVRHEGDRHLLVKAADQNKDQTYFLNQLSAEQLRDVIFPLAGLKKEEVRQIAQKHGLATAEKKDSTGICFIGERNFRKFLMNYLPAREGDIRTLDGTTVGRHVGLMYYTIGQRKGLDVGGRKGDEGRWFVIDKDLKNNVLYIAHGSEEKLYSRSLETAPFNWICDRKTGAFRCTAKIRYRQEEQPCTCTVLDGGGVQLDFDSPQRAVTEGQFAVLYEGDVCLGGGEIISRSAPHVVL